MKREDQREKAPAAKETRDNGGFASEFRRGDPGSPKIALTFDAGSGVGDTQGLLDTLAARGIHSTFFLTGKWAAAHPDLVRKIAAAGHEIGNHTYSHRHLPKLDMEQTTVELDKTESLIVKLTGVSTKPLFRVPYGDRDEQVMSRLQELGYVSIYWDVDSWDSVVKGITAEQIKQRVLDKVRNGSVVLMHCGSIPTAEALDSLITELQSAGYQPVTVSELMGRQHPPAQGSTP